MTRHQAFRQVDLRRFVVFYGKMSVTTLEHYHVSVEWTCPRFSVVEFRADTFTPQSIDNTIYFVVQLIARPHSLRRWIFVPKFIIIILELLKFSNQRSSRHEYDIESLSLTISSVDLKIYHYTIFNIELLYAKAMLESEADAGTERLLENEPLRLHAS